MSTKLAATLYARLKILTVHKSRRRRIYYLFTFSSKSMDTDSKRLKLENTRNFKIKAILADEYVQEIPLVTVYVSKIDVKQRISLIMQELSQHLPLPKLQHLKRVRQNEIIICHTEELATNESLEEFLKRTQLSQIVIELICATVLIAKVPAAATKLRWQYQMMCRHWPCKFHPDKRLEALYDGSNFSNAQRSFHEKMARLVLHLSAELEVHKPVGICVDPRKGAIVALAVSRTDINPVMHCPLVLIDFVARSQHSGAWQSRIEEEFIKDTDMTSKTTLAGVPKRYLNFLQNDLLLQDLKFGAERVNENAKTNYAEGEDNLSKYGPYLCTGYDMYLTDEPCLMCCMALVHSRAKRIFFVRCSQNGALKTHYTLHAVKELNHHYEVYQCEMTEEQEPITKSIATNFNGS